MCPIVVAQMRLTRYLQQLSMDPCGTHVDCMWDQFWSLWATHTGYMGLMSLGGRGVANNKGADQPALLLSLISPFVIRFFVIYHN